MKPFGDMANLFSFGTHWGKKKKKKKKKRCQSISWFFGISEPSLHTLLPEKRPRRSTVTQTTYSSSLFIQTGTLKAARSSIDIEQQRWKANPYKRWLHLHGPMIGTKCCSGPDGGSTGDYINIGALFSTVVTSKRVVTISDTNSDK